MTDPPIEKIVEWVSMHFCDEYMNWKDISTIKTKLRAALTCFRKQVQQDTARTIGMAAALAGIPILELDKKESWEAAREQIRSDRDAEIVQEK